MQRERQVDEGLQIAPASDRTDIDRHSARQRICRHEPTSSPRSATTSAAEVLAAAREADVLPYFHLLSSPAMPVVEMEGAPRIMLGSNNYLGLTADERVLKGAEDALHRYGTGLTGSRLLNGTIPLHLELEREIADWMDAEEALVFSTGHQANVGTLGTLLGPSDTVIVDAGDHASILDGCLLSRAKLRPFRHNRLEKLEKMLDRASGDGGGVLVVVDGVFSMEGDLAPLAEISELCTRYGARLMVDEAHGAGVLGARGAGACELLGVVDRADVRIGTFSKSLASCGGFVAGPHEVIDYLRFSSRAFLFTASAVPAAVGAALAALRVLRGEDGPRLLARVLENAWYLHEGLHRARLRRLAAPAAGPARGRPGARPGGASRRRRHPDAGDADHLPAGRRRLEGGAAVAGPLRRGGVREHRAASGRSSGRRAAAHERDGDPRRGHAGPLPGDLRQRQARLRARARPAALLAACIGTPWPHSRAGHVVQRGPVELVHFFTSPSGNKKARF